MKVSFHRGHLGVAVVALFCLAVGFWLGRTSSGSAKMLPQTFGAPQSPSPGQSLSPSNNSTSQTGGIGGAAGSTKSPEELQKNISDLSELLRSKRGYNHYKEIIKKVAFLEEGQFADAVTACLDAPKKRNWQREAALMEVFSRWGKTDHDAALARAKELPANLRKNALASVARGWAETDPTAVAAYGKTLPNGETRQSFLASAATELTDKDPQAAFALRDEIPPGPSRSSVTWEIFSAWADSSADAALATATKIKNSSERNRALQAVINSWSENQPQAAFDWVRGSQLDGEQKNRLVNDILSSWAVADPKGASEALEAVLGGASATPNASSLISGVAYGLYSENVETALDWMQHLSGDAKLSAMRSIASAWSWEDGEAARQWATSLPPGDERLKVLPEIARAWSWTDCAAARSWALNLPAGEERDKVIPAIARAWGEYEPKAAAEWTERLPEGDGNDNVFRDVVTRWTAAEQEKVADWIDGLPEGRRHDVAVQAFCQTLRGDDPTTAIKIAKTIDDERLRTDTLKSVVTRWLDSNPEAAKSWDGRSELPPEIKKLFDK